MRKWILFILIVVMVISVYGCHFQTDITIHSSIPSSTTPLPTEHIATSQPTEQPTIAPFIDPTVNVPCIYGKDNVFFITVDECLYGWGNNQYGQVGNGTTETKLQPVFIGMNLTPVSIGDTVFAVDKDGTLWGWGRNDGAQLGLGHTNPVLAPAKIIDHVKEVYSYSDSTYVLTADGNIYTWGFNVDDRAITEEYKQQHTTPILLKDNVKEYDNMHAITNDNELWMIWRGGFEPSFVTSDVKQAWGWNCILIEDTEGKLYERDIITNERTLICDSFSSLIYSDGTAYILMQNGDLFTYNTIYTEVREIPESDCHKLVYVMSDVSEFYTDTYCDEDWGYDYKFALKNNGDLWAWTIYDHAVVGKTENQIGYIPECVAHNVLKVVSNGMSTYLLLNNGEVWASGQSIDYLDGTYLHGGLGDGTTTTQYGFIPIITGDTFKSSVCMVYNFFNEKYESDNVGDWVMFYSRTFVVDENGKIYAWGWNGDFLLDFQVSTGEILSPVEIHLTK